MHTFGGVLITSQAKEVRALVIEDSWLEASLIKDYLQIELKKNGFDPSIDSAETEKESYKALSKNDYDIVVFDIDLDRRGAGLDLLDRFSSKITLPVISSARQSSQSVTKAYKSGCAHFLQKPVKESKIETIVSEFKKKTASRDITRLIQSKYITQDIETINELTKIISCGNTNTHITGPTGVGKQVVAELIHEINKSSNLPFIERNCSSVSESLADSFLFGHKKGSFTGASEDRKGIFELANGGTIFLDEIDKTPKAFQAKLLKVIEQKEIIAVGADIPKKVEFTLITASSSDLNSLVEKDLFLPDLWERLQGEVIHLKGLSERPKDIGHQLNHFIRTHSSGRLFVISDEAQDFLNRYSWPGNTRELKSLVDRFQKKNVKLLEMSDLKFLEQKIIKQQYGLLNPQILKIAETDGLASALEEISREVIQYFYQQNHQKKRPTIRQLGISPHTLYKYLSESKKEAGNANQP